MRDDPKIEQLMRAGYIHSEFEMPVCEKCGEPIDWERALIQTEDPIGEFPCEALCEDCFLKWVKSLKSVQIAEFMGFKVTYPRWA